MLSGDIDAFHGISCDRSHIEALLGKGSPQGFAKELSVVDNDYG
jgi:hypothetical protein